MQPPGQIAQSVEQGIENPRVGGSTPSLATFSQRHQAPLVALFVLGLSGCGVDACDQLCVDAAALVDGCVDGWPIGWESLGAPGQVGFRNRCQQDWSDRRARLESWELDEALDQCEAGSDALERSVADGSTCDQLRALYVPD